MSHINLQIQGLPNEKHGAIRKTALATAIGIVLGVSAGNTLAALAPDDALLFAPGAAICTSGGPVSTCAFGGTDMGGSYFTMDMNGDGVVATSEKTALSRVVRGDGTSGIVLGQIHASSGQHTGAPSGTESPAIDNPWNFFGNTGMHNLSSGVSLISDQGSGTYTLDFSGWGVNWGEYGPTGAAGSTIDMGGVATIVCDPVGCGHDSNFALDMAVHVPVAFTSVPYTLHLEGTIALPGPPELVADAVTTIVGNPIDISVTTNDVSANGLDLDSVAVVSAATNGVTVDTDPSGEITYTPNTGPDFVGTDSFTYTVNSGTGVTAVDPATVTVDVQANVAPVAADDTLSVSTAVLNNTSQTVSVLDNDTDANNASGLPGGINVATVTVVDQPASGTCTANVNGTVTYAQTNPSVAGAFSCTYRVSDTDSFGTPLQSNLATLGISVTTTQSDWPTALDPDIIPILFFEPGVKGDPTDSSVPATGGSYFTMRMTPTSTVYTVMAPGPAGGIVIGHAQPGSGAHTGAPAGTEEIGVDQAWNFFSNTGLHYTEDDGITGNSDGTLDFARKWFVAWGGIPAIDMGGDTTGTFPEDLGNATIACTPAPCADQSTFELDYEAHVPPGDPSGFGGVPYGLKLVGTVGFLDGTLMASDGLVSSETRLPAGPLTETDPDSEVLLQCVGDCFEYTVSGVTVSRVSIVFPLAGGVPQNPVWRILDGTWSSFDTSAGDTILSAPFVQGDGQLECPPPGDAAYVALTTGHQCVQLSIADNGLNDLNPALGTISDPGGMGSGGDAGGGTVFVDTRTSSTSGCSVMGDNASPLQRGDLGLLAGFIAWLGWNHSRRAKKQ